MEAGFERLEKVFTQSYQDVTARLTLLEGEVKILAGRLSEKLEQERTSTVTESQAAAPTPVPTRKVEIGSSKSFSRLKKAWWVVGH